MDAVVYEMGSTVINASLEDARRVDDISMELVPMGRVSIFAAGERAGTWELSALGSQVDSPNWVPLAATPGTTWFALDQGWYLSTIEYADRTYIFEADFDELLALNGSHRAATKTPGQVSISGVRALWHSVPTDEFRARWQIINRSLRS